MESWQRQFIRYLFPYSASRLQIERAFIAKHPHIPRFLYKYQEFKDTHMDALENGVLYMSSPDRFNDPFDTTIFYDPDRFLIEDKSVEDSLAEVAKLRDNSSSSPSWSQQPLKRPIQAREWRRKIVDEVLAQEPSDIRAKAVAIFEDVQRKISDEMVRQMSDHFRSNYSVLSLSADPASILMWSHYSGSHRGFCVRKPSTGRYAPQTLRPRLLPRQENRRHTLHGRYGRFEFQ